MPIFVIAIVFLLMVGLHSYLYNRLWDKGLDYDAKFSVNEAFEGDVLFLREVITNKKFLPLPMIRSKTMIPIAFTMYDSNGDEIDPRGAGSNICGLGMYSKLNRKQQFICNKRGYYRLTNASLGVSNLLHTGQFFKTFRVSPDLLIFPKLLTDSPEVNILFRYLDGIIVSKQLINPDPFEFRGIRDYLPTDALKFINFKASAIAQKLMVNIHAPTDTRRLTIVLNLEPMKHTPPPELYEQTIRLTATLAQKYIEDGVSLGFVTNGRDVRADRPADLSPGTSESHLYRIYECLARISLSLRRAPIKEYCEGIVDRDQIYLFISPYAEHDFFDAVQDLKDRGIDSLVVTPYLKGVTEVPKGINSILWDATLPVQEEVEQVDI